MAKSSMFRKGYGAVQAEKKRQDEAREKAGSRLWNFFLRNDGDEATIRFLTEEPINFDAHVVKSGNNYDTVICPGEDCELCDSGEKTSFKGAYLVIDRRSVEISDRENPKKKRTVNAQLRLFIQGARVLSQLDRYSQKYGLTKRDYTIARVGTGQNTSYSFDPEEPSKLTPAEVKNLLPEKLRDTYAGNMESLYEILEDQLQLMVGGEESDNDSDDDEDEDLMEEKRRRRNLIKDEEDEDDDDTEDEDEDDEDEEPPKSSSKTLPRPKASNKSKPSVKGAFRSRK